MSYTPTNWQTGDVVTAALLNKMEQGIASGDGGSGVLVAHATVDGGSLSSEPTPITLDKTLEELLAEEVTAIALDVQQDGVTVDQILAVRTEKMNSGLYDMLMYEVLTQNLGIIIIGVGPPEIAGETGAIVLKMSAALGGREYRNLILEENGGSWTIIAQSDVRDYSTAFDAYQNALIRIVRLGKYLSLDFFDYNNVNNICYLKAHDTDTTANTETVYDITLNDYGASSIVVKTYTLTPAV